MARNLFSVLLLCITTGLPAQNVSYKYDNAGNRTERVIVMQSSSAALRSAEASTAVDDIVAGQTIKIYPNPTRGMLAVEIDNYSDDLHAGFVLTDMAGKIIYRQQAVSASTSLNLSNHPAGIYLLRITLNNKTAVWKIIKE